MKVDLEKVKLSVSPLTGEVYIGVTNKSGDKWLHKKQVTNEFYDAALKKFLGTDKKKTSKISSGSDNWEITIEKK